MSIQSLIEKVLWTIETREPDLYNAIELVLSEFSGEIQNPDLVAAELEIVLGF